MDELYHKIGAPIVGQHPSVFELVVSDHVTWADPHTYGLDRAGINPIDYFITSGDAIEKTIVLDRQLWQLAGALRKELFQLIADDNKCDLAAAQSLYRGGVRPHTLPTFPDYEAAVWRAAGQCRKLLNALKIAKGDNVFLETEWVDRKLLVIPKNPRR